jgi:hypothetical protein
MWQSSTDQLVLDHNTSFKIDNDAAVQYGSNDGAGYDIDTLYDFMAARGRRSDDNDDYFWANRGKRVSAHERTTRNSLSNQPRPNGFLFVVNLSFSFQRLLFVERSSTKEYIHHPSPQFGNECKNS